MKGFGNIKKIISTKSIPTRVENYVSNHVTTKQKTKNVIIKVYEIDEIIDNKLSKLPYQIDEILFEEEKNQKKNNDDNDKNDDNHNNNDDNDDDGMKFPIPRFGVKY